MSSPVGQTHDVPSEAAGIKVTCRLIRFAKHGRSDGGSQTKDRAIRSFALMADDVRPNR
jgi:hypothetical protein